jgi:hypothetical protein
MEKTNMLENSKRLVTAAREAGCTIVHVPINFEKVNTLELFVLGGRKCHLVPSYNCIKLIWLFAGPQ